MLVSGGGQNGRQYHTMPIYAWTGQCIKNGSGIHASAYILRECTSPGVLGLEPLLTS